MKKREIPFMAQYENEFGYHEWTTLDSANNLVRCYYNGDTELHVKEPWCECNGVRMRKVRNQEKWRCPICGKVYDISDIDWPMPYWDDETGLKNDYGEYMYPNAEKRAGPPEMYEGSSLYLVSVRRKFEDCHDCGSPYIFTLLKD